MESLGPFVPFGMLALGGLYGLTREMLRREEVHREQLAAKDLRIKELEGQVSDLSNRAIEQAGLQGPLLAKATEVLSEAVDAFTERQG